MAYKSSRVLFQDQFSQMLNPGSAPTATQGGTNPTQIGLGVRLGYVSPNFTQGTLQSTGRNMDLGVQGDGFFIYGQDAGRRYSREGSMSLDAEGYLVNSATGLRTQGWLTGANGIDTNLPVGISRSIRIKPLPRLRRMCTSGRQSERCNTNRWHRLGQVSMGVYDSLGALYRLLRSNSPAQLLIRSSGIGQWSTLRPDFLMPTKGVGDGTITFDANGQLDTNIGNRIRL